MVMENEISCLSIGDRGKIECVYPMCFGVSCAFVALQLFSTAKKLKSSTSLGDHGWSSVRDGILLGSAQLLGLLVWEAQREERIAGRSELLSKLRKAEAEVAEMKRRRTEDAKANEKVVTIFAAQEQCWLTERKKLRQHLQAVLKDLRELENKSCSSCVHKEGIISKLKDTITEKEILVESKIKDLEEEDKRRKDLGEKLEKAEAVAEELRERLQKEAQEHCSELWKHKTAFIELVSNQRQLEAERGRALRRAEAAKEELDSVFEQKEESTAMVQKLSVEVVRMEKELDQKDKIMSAMLRKSKLDTAEKQKVLRELRISKAKRKQAELEAERWKTLCESKDHLRHSKQSRSISANRAEFRSETLLEVKRLPSVETGCSQIHKSEPEKHRNIGEMQHSSSGSYWNPKTLLLEYLEAEKKMSITAVDNINRYSPEGNGDLLTSANIQQLEEWVQSETEKYATILEQRHYAEVEAFAEQMRLKDEKLEAFRWQLLSMEIESKRLQSHIEGLDENLSQFRDENMKLEALLLDKEKVLKSLKERFTFHAKHCRSNSNDQILSPVLDPDTIWSEVKIIKRKLMEKEQEHKATLVRVSQEVETEFRERDNRMAIMEAKLVQATLQYERERKEKERIASNIMRTRSMPLPEHFKDQQADLELEGSSSKEIERRENRNGDQSQDMKSIARVPEGEIEEDIKEEKVVSTNHGTIQEEGIKVNCREEAEVIDKSASVDHILTRKDLSWKMDVHAMGVSYKIKRLNQQLLMLEKMTEAQAAKMEIGKNDHEQIKGLISVISLLNKQVRRYQSLEEKTNDLCKRMHENDRSGSTRESIGRTKEQTEILGQFLEETFQLQRYMVATGQKLVEIQSVIARSFVGVVDWLKESMGFNVRHFSDSVRTLLREIQRGLEVRIARIIGDLEGTLACEGMLHLTN